GFPFETREPFGVGRKPDRQDLEGDVPIEFGITGAIHLAHAALSNEGLDLVDAETSTGREGQLPSIIWAGQDADGMAGKAREVDPAGTVALAAGGRILRMPWYAGGLEREGGRAARRPLAGLKACATRGRYRRLKGLRYQRPPLISQCALRTPSLRSTRLA